MISIWPQCEHTSVCNKVNHMMIFYWLKKWSLYDLNVSIQVCASLKSPIDSLIISKWYHIEIANVIWVEEHEAVMLEENCERRRGREWRVFVSLQLPTAAHSFVFAIHTSLFLNFVAHISDENMDSVMRVALARSIEPNIATLAKRKRFQVSSWNFIFFCFKFLRNSWYGRI